jgi:hypothetical protein
VALKQLTQNSTAPLVPQNITTSDFLRERDNSISVRLVELKPDTGVPIAVTVIQQNHKVSATYQFQKYVLVLTTRQTLGFASLQEECFLVRINRNVVQGAVIQAISRFVM